MVGCFILGQIIMFIILTLAAKDMPTAEFKTFVIQSAAPALAVLPILAGQGNEDLEFSTNVVNLSTVLFVVIPIIMIFLG